MKTTICKYSLSCRGRYQLKQNVKCCSGRERVNRPIYQQLPSLKPQLRRKLASSPDSSPIPKRANRRIRSSTRYAIRRENAPSHFRTSITTPFPGYTHTRACSRERKRKRKRSKRSLANCRDKTEKRMDYESLYRSIDARMARSKEEKETEGCATDRFLKL